VPSATKKKKQSRESSESTWNLEIEWREKRERERGKDREVSMWDVPNNRGITRVIEKSQSGISKIFNRNKTSYKVLHKTVNCKLSFELSIFKV